MGNLISKVGLGSIYQTTPLNCLDPALAWEQLKHSTPVIELKVDSPEEPLSQDKIRFVHISDTHSLTSYIESIPEGDVFLHTGDFTMRGGMQEVIEFNQWLGSLPFKYKVVIAGNHDLCFDPNVVQGKNGKSDAMKALLTNCIYLEDSSVTLYGIKIYGSPYQPEFGDMDAFTLKKGTKECQEKWDQIPDDTDILMTHGPPLGIGDLARPWREPGTTKVCGCVELLKTIRERVRPSYHLYGHIHEDYGIRSDGTTTYINAAYAGDHNKATDKKPIVFDLALPKGEIKSD